MITQTLRSIPRHFLPVALLLAGSLLSAQTQKQVSPKPGVAPTVKMDISGMYTFLQDGEFVQINVETPAQSPVHEVTDAKRAGSAKPTAVVMARVVTGFVSRFGDLESDKGAFLDHFFSKGALAGSELSFSTKTVHGVSYEFKGHVERGTAKTLAEEGYYLLRGTLKRNSVDAGSKQTSSQSREVLLKSFPDLDTDEPIPSGSSER